MEKRSKKLASSLVASLDINSDMDFEQRTVLVENALVGDSLATGKKRVGVISELEPAQPTSIVDQCGGLEGLVKEFIVALEGSATTITTEDRDRLTELLRLPEEDFVQRLAERIDDMSDEDRGIIKNMCDLPKKPTPTPAEESARRAAQEQREEVEFEKVREIVEGEFDFHVIDESDKRPVVAFFHSPKCGRCQIIGPMLEELLSGEELKHVALRRIHLFEQQGIIQRLLKMPAPGLPTVRVYYHGTIVADVSGNLSREQLAGFLSEYAG